MKYVGGRRFSRLDGKCETVHYQKTHLDDRAKVKSDRLMSQNIINELQIKEREFPNKLILSGQIERPEMVRRVLFFKNTDH